MVQEIELENMTGQEIKEMIDDKKITLEELTYSSLMKVFDYETDMLVLGTGDMDFIDKCSKLLDEKEPDEVISDERFDEILQKTFAEHVVIIENEEKVPEAKPNYPAKRIILRRIAIVAAIIAIMLTSTTLIAAAFGVNIFEYIKEVVRKPQGSEIVVDEFTFYNNNEIKKYSSIQELVEEENLDIMYPTKLPDGVTVKSIRKTTNTKGNQIVQIFTNDIYVGINIELSGTPLKTNNNDVFEYNQIKYYIQEGESFGAACYYDNNVYTLTAKTRADLIDIIKNMYLKKVAKPGGGTIQVGKTTFYCSGVAKEYSSIEEFVEAEKLDIMFPTKFSDGINITDVVLDKMENGKDTVMIYTDDINVNVVIELSSELIETKNEDKYESNGTVYYFNETPIGMNAYCYYNGNMYNINANNREELILIIESFKEA